MGNDDSTDTENHTEDCGAPAEKVIETDRINRSRAKRYLVTLVKFAISFAILAFLFYRAANNDAFGSLWTSEKQWWRLTLALVVALAAFCISFFRWFLLVRALDLPLTIGDSFRFGFIGFLFNFLTFGVLGGDAVKAIFVARHAPGHRTEAITTVFIDRAFGLFGLFVLTSIAYFFLQSPEEVASESSVLVNWKAVEFVCQVSIVLTICGLLGIGMIFFFHNINRSKFFQMIHRVPFVGPIFKKGVDAILTYRHHPFTLFHSLLLSVAIHVLLTISFFLVASGISDACPGIGNHFVIVPIANVANAIPLPMGLGAMEATIDSLYVVLGDGVVKPGVGLIAALCFRVITLIIAVIGVVYYFAHKKQVNQLMREAESIQD